MKLQTIELSVTELQQALRDYAEKHCPSQPAVVVVNNGFGKTVLHVPLAPGAVVMGTDFTRATEVE